MRLINADELKKADFQDFSNTDVMNAIDRQPTAYDVDKVIRQMNDRVDRFKTDEIDLEDAIKIVKAGGMNDRVDSFITDAISIEDAIKIGKAGEMNEH